METRWGGETFEKWYSKGLKFGCKTAVDVEQLVGFGSVGNGIYSAVMASRSMSLSGVVMMHCRGVSSELFFHSLDFTMVGLQSRVLCTVADGKVLNLTVAPLVNHSWVNINVPKKKKEKFNVWSANRQKQKSLLCVRLPHRHRRSAPSLKMERLSDLTSK